MKKRVHGVLLCVVLALGLRGAALAHLDTLMQVLQPPPVVVETDAENCPGIGKAQIVSDLQATGGKAVQVTASRPSFRVNLGKLQRSCYVLYVIAKVDDDNAWVTVKGMKWATVQRRPMYVTLRLTREGGDTEEHSNRVPFTDTYQDICHIYFHVPFAGRYTAEVVVEPPKGVNALVDRIQLRDALAETVRKPLKTGRMLLTDEEIARMRKTATHEARRAYRPLRKTPMTWEERQRRDDTIWNNMAPMNANYAGRQLYYGIERSKALPVLLKRIEKEKGKELGGWKHASARGFQYDEPFVLVNKPLGLQYTMQDYQANRPLPEPWPFPERKGGIFIDKAEWGTESSFNYGMIPGFMKLQYHTATNALRSDSKGLAWRYLVHNDWSAAEDAALLLAGYAYRYCGYDFRAHCMVNIYPKGRRFRPGHGFGRGTAYTGWSRKDVAHVLRSYDMLFPYIKDNKRLATRVGRYIPWVREPQDVVALIDTCLVQRAALDGIRMVLYSPIIPAAAVTLGPNDVSKRILDRYFTKAYLRNTLSGFPDSIVNAYSRDGLNYIGSTYYVQGESGGELGQVAELLRRYVRAGGNRKFDVADPRRFPRFAALPETLLQIYVAGGFGSNIGDVAAPDGPPRYNPHPKSHEQLYLSAWRRTGEPRFAWILRNLVSTQGQASNKEWAKIAKQAAETRDVTLHAPSRFVGGFGLAVMEEGVDSVNPLDKRCVTVRTGVASGHAHPDSLDIQFYTRGLRMLSDLGGRISGKYGKPTCMSSYVHNVVEVDEASHVGGPRNSTGTAWLEAFKPCPGLQFTLAAARAESHPQVSTYRRAVALIGVEENGPDAYVFDVFRTAGGKVHTWAFHGCPPDEFHVNTSLKPAESETTTRYLNRHGPGSQREGIAPAALEAVWRLRRKEETVRIGDKDLKLRNYEKKMLRKAYDPNSPPKYTRVTLLGHGGDSVLVGNWYCTAFRGREFDWPFLYVRREKRTTQESVWPAVIEAYEGERFIESITPLAVTGGEQGALAPVALRVRLKGGRRDTLFSSGVPGASCTFDGGRVQAAFAAGSRTGDTYRLHMVEGTEYAVDDLPSVKADAAAYEAVIDFVDYRNLRMRVRSDLPEGPLVGEQLFISNDRHFTNARIVNVRRLAKGRAELTFARSACLYQGGVSEIDEEKGHAVLDLPPYLYDYHPMYYEGMTAADERGRILGKVSVKRGGRFMYLGYPEWHRHVQSVRLEDVPDANKDGKRVLRMFAADQKSKRRMPDGSTRKLAVGDHLLDLEVTGVSDDGLTLYYADHPMDLLDSIDAPHRGWPYHEQILKNESGTKQWISTFPGDTYHLKIDKRKLRKADFSDPDGNGRAMVRFYDFGPGDRVRIPTHVYLRRSEEGTIEVRANVGFRMGARESGMQLSVDGKTWKGLPIERAGRAATFRITTADLADGRVLLRPR